MDFLDPVKKRQHRIRLIVGYFLIAIAILLGSFILLLQSYGYDIDRRTGQVIQNGLVYVSSHPVSANVYVNGQLKGNTNLKLTIPAGNYSFVIKSRGYRDWLTTVNLAGGDVEQLTYPLLVPQNLTTKDVQPYTKAPNLASLSLDRHWLMVLRPGSLTDFDVFDLTKPTSKPAVYKIPSSLLHLATGTQLLKTVEWASDNRHLLIEHDFNGGKEFIMLDREDASKSYNLNQLMTIVPDKVTLRNKRFDRMYAYIAKTKAVLAVDTSSKQVTSILQNVLEYTSSGDNTILYTSDVSKVAKQYAVNIWDGQKSYLLNNYPATNYFLNMAQYSDQTYVVVAPVSAGKVYIYKNPLGVMRAGKVPNPFIALKIKNPQVVSFSANARFIGAQSGSSFAVYDFEKSLWHYFSLKEKVPVTSKVEWMDGNRFVLNIAGTVNIFDFNGDNQQKLVPGNIGSNGFFDRNFSHFYSLAPSVQVSGQQALTGTSLVVGKN